MFQSRSLEKHEITPLVADGVMYTAQSPNDVFALNAATGKTLWRYTHTPEEGVRTPWKLTRGLAILDDKLFLAALDARMIALDARTGKELWNTKVADHRLQYSFTGAPLVVKDKVITGVAGGEYGIRGFLAAYDVNTGKEVWRFYTIPGPGEPGHETWLGQDGKPNDSYLHGGAPIWVTGSYDPETNLTFWAPEIRVRTTTAITGWVTTCTVRRWSPWMQTRGNCGGIISSLLTTNSIGIPRRLRCWPISTSTARPRKVMMWANRNGVFYVLDRTNGQFLSGKSFIKTNWVSGFDERGRPIRAPGTLSTQEGTLIYPATRAAPTGIHRPSVR